jgi:hypothetical protein
MPPEIAACPVPVYCACQYGAAKKRPHEKSNTRSVSGSPTAPGDFVSVDQMVAGNPGLLPFTSGRPSKRCYDTVTMWVDHFLRFIYAHCQEDATSTTKSTLESKVGFELSSNTFMAITVFLLINYSRTMSKPPHSINPFAGSAPIGRTELSNTSLV